MPKNARLEKEDNIIYLFIALYMNIQIFMTSLWCIEISALPRKHETLFTFTTVKVISK